MTMNGDRSQEECMTLSALWSLVYALSGKKKKKKNYKLAFVFVKFNSQESRL